MKLKTLIALLVLMAAVSVGSTAGAQTTTTTPPPAPTLLSDDFTGATSSSDPNTGLGNWLFYNGACLTAGNGTALSAGFDATGSPMITPGSTVPATIPGCQAVLQNYYNVAPRAPSTSQKIADPYLVGGDKGYLGGTAAPASVSSQQPDAAGSGALRFTNGTPAANGNIGKGENGAIVSTNAYPTGNGIQVTFKTVTYYGDSLGNGQTNNTQTGVTPNGADGADGMSFYLMDGCVPLQGAVMPTACSPSANPIYQIPQLTQAIGAWGGSLAYTCSNTNSPADGLVGAYLGVGIDEYGNFLNGTSNTFNFGTNNNLGDNTATGGGQYANRIGLRGAGSIAWQALTNAYGVNPGNVNAPYYPASLSTSCSTGTLNTGTNNCDSCPTGTTYGLNGSTQQCATTTYSCPRGDIASNNNATCVSTTCPGSGYTYADPSSTNNLGTCSKTSGRTTVTESPTTNGATTATTTWQNPPTVAPVDGRQAAVVNTCKTGTLYNYSTNPPTAAGAAATSNALNTAGIMDYPAIPGGFSTLPAGTSIANEGATTRSKATVIYYNLSITSGGLLSLSYALSDATRAGGVGAYQPVLTNQQITTSNGTEPAYVRFGFAGSTGGGTNVHEILCFKSAASNQSASSAGVNEKQSAKVESGTFAYFAYYDPDNWVGRVTADALSTNTDSSGNTTITISSPTWDASCELSGVAAGQTCSTGVVGPVLPPEPEASRVIATWNGTKGVPFEAASVSGTQLATLDLGDSTATDTYRLDYLHGVQKYEVTANGTCSLPTGLPACFRARTSLLGDIVDSSPTWVGPPQSPYTVTWKDLLNPTATALENSGQSYLTFTSTYEQRTNLVYVGANDGMLHAFRSGSYTSAGQFDTSNTVPNDGWEVFAYVPGAILQSALSGSGGCTGTNAAAATGSVVQNIHGVTPAASGGTPAACTLPALDFSNIQYGHNFFVDATPGTGDLYYGNAWHTWLVGGMGPGGADIYALDVTDPASAIAAAGSTPESGAAGLVIGEWTAGTGAGALTCATQSNCGNNLGNTYGTPIIRRLHDGSWGVIFGNGFGSSTGDAGIYVMIVNSSGQPSNVYYLSTGTAGTANGIAYVTSADLDGDHITDYVYAGDLNGNVWRFDLTNVSEATWVSTPPFKLFTTAAGQPITSALVVASGATSAGANTLMIDFGTGQKFPLTNLGGAGYATSATQSLYGVWDWNLTTWNTKSNVQYAALSPAAANLSSPTNTIVMPSSGTAPLQIQTTTLNSNANGTTNGTPNGDVTGASAVVCWMGSPACTMGQFGWYLPLLGAGEQIVYNPQVLGNVFEVNSVVPAVNSPTACSVANDTGFTYAVSILSGAVVPNFFIQYHDAATAVAEETDATGTSFPVTTGNGSTWLIYQTTTNTPSTLHANLAANNVGRRLTWVQVR